ncbi:lytic transglycosylase domain-containing protein [Campylobacter sp. IFREMER_LSEM_CL292]|uniref:lytic transglycosylase domain-containing protein n=1 Tax=Campylobacter TaxID=194 RepID=UPI00105A8BAC|nr:MULTISPECIES: lytic transglycosylase domain-containing protein [Campylobacter]EAI4440987.1 lytic transglycosylase domain-containing protein [Campylobacter lari]EDP6879751.1 transglycosylase SLT domain-containing protein [Campylobacter lari]EGK8128151.1 lytic transglycosylase domain-containing protein [Campylobacter lari]ELF2320260.1 lytic transglycosylase domain-containing protein [Campylobacter lari]MCV3382632.1 lytic transglycosylase domain-containing protein [Campylobacter sp. IFREMER_LS
MLKRILLLAIFFNFTFAFDTKIFIGDIYIPENFYKYDKDFKIAARKYNIPMALLKAIALTENAAYEHNIIGRNKNQTRDYGLMQINSIHLKRYGVSEKEIVKVSANIDIAARLLYEIIQRYGFNWNAIGRYHSANDKYKNIWLDKVMKNLVAIVLKDSKDLFVMEKFRAFKLVSLLINVDKEQYRILLASNN